MVLVGLFFKKSVLGFVVKILCKYTNKEFLKIPSSQILFKDFDHNYYINSSKYGTYLFFSKNMSQ